MIRRLAVALAALALLAGCSTNTNDGQSTATSGSAPPSTESSAAAVTPEQARAIAKEAYIYGFPMVDNYRVQYHYFVDKQDPEYKGGWNEIHNTARVYTPDDTTIQTPNSDTPYSSVGADLRTEPLVLTVPPIEQNRYYSLQFIDGYTYNFAYVGSRTTGNGGGKYLLAGPNWKGDKPEGVNEVIRSDTDLAFVLYRTQLFGPVGHRQREEDPGRLPGHAAVGVPQPAAARHPRPPIDFVPPLTADQQRTSPQFFEILNFVLRFAPTLPAEKRVARPVRQHRHRRRGWLRRRRAEPGDAAGDRSRDSRCLGGVRRVQEVRIDTGKVTSAQFFGTDRRPQGQLPVPDGRRGARHLRQHRRRSYLPELLHRRRRRAADRCEQLHLPVPLRAAATGERVLVADHVRVARTASWSPTRSTGT